MKSIKQEKVEARSEHNDGSNDLTSTLFPLSHELEKLGGVLIQTDMICFTVILEHLHPAKAGQSHHDHLQWQYPALSFLHHFASQATRLPQLELS